jgi:hypothetical protein
VNAPLCFCSGLASSEGDVDVFMDVVGGNNNLRVAS